MFRMRADLIAAGGSYQTLKSRVGFKPSGRERPAGRSASDDAGLPAEEMWESFGQVKPGNGWPGLPFVISG